MNKNAKRISAALMAGVAALALTACSEDNDGKPSKAEAKEGYKKIAVEMVGQDEAAAIGDEALMKFADCVIEEVYDSMSVETLKAMVEVNLEYEGSDEEGELLHEAVNKCEGELGA